jgi:hypothetical protein
MNREVFLSILAMDSYQRGYAVGINGVAGTKIGNATISRQSDIRQGSPEVAAGFYALSYQWGTDTVISYRGTDFDAANGLLEGDSILTKISKAIDGEFGKDLWNGWSTFTGFGTNSAH